MENKVYKISYTFTTHAYGTEGKEYREELFSYKQLQDFIDRVKYLSADDKWYIDNLRVYSGEVSEIDVNKVLNPF